MIEFKARTLSGEIIRSAVTPLMFPAGERHIKREERRELEPVEIAIVTFSPESMHDDLFQLSMWSRYIEHNELEPNKHLVEGERYPKRVLIMPYLPGARADRGEPLGAQVYAQFVGDLGLDQIITFDPHSSKWLDDYYHYAAGNPEYTVLQPHDLLKTRLAKVVLPHTYDAVIAPDKGALHRAGQVAEMMGVELLRVDKTRDFATGKLLGFTFDGSQLPKDAKRLLVVDDICDGGGTFMGVADAVAAETDATLDLYISHSILSHRALELLPTKYRKIYSTNSFRPEILNRDNKEIKWDLRETEMAFEWIDVIRPLLNLVQP